MLKENYLVEKSKSLVWAQFKDYGTGELKILDTYLSRIDPRKPDSSYVTFTKKEYAELMGLDGDLRTSQIKNYTRGLLSNVVTMELPNEDGYVQYPLFSEARCRYDEKANQTVIEIDCNPKLKNIFFDIAEDGYVRYQLKNVISLRSQYSIRLYTIMKDRPFGWKVDIDTLRKLLGATASTYDEFKRFNSLILKKSIDEVNEKTDIEIETNYIRKGRSVSAIEFKRINKAVVTQLPPNMKTIEVEAEPEEDSPQGTDLFAVPDANDELAICTEALPEDFTRSQVEALRYLAVKIVPFDPHDIIPYECRLAEYLRSKVLLMKASSTPVKKPFGWLKTVIEADLEKQ